MWYVYRAPGKFTGWKFTTPFEEHAMNVEMKVATQMRVDLIEAHKTCKQIGYDGIQVGDTHVIWMPTAFGLVYGFIWKQEKMGTAFIASQVPLEYMHDDIDWDARTDSEAINRVKKAVSGIDPTAKEEAPMFKHISSPWQTSKKNNQWRKINGFLCSTFSKAGRGFGGIISNPDDGKKCFTKSMPTEQEVMDYIDENWPTLIQEVE